MPVYREATNLYRIRVWMGNRPHSEMFRGGRGAAVAREADLRRELAREAVAPRGAVPNFLGFLQAEYLPAARLRLRKSWLRNLTYTLVTISEMLGDLQLDQITVPMIEEYARQRLDGRSPVTVNNELRVLRRVLAVAVARGHIAAVPKVPPLPEPHKTIAVWSEVDLVALLDATARVSPRVLGIVTFLANTGCRRGEPLALRWQDVDFERRLVKIWPSDEWQPKSGRPREVPISDPLLPWLQLPRRSDYVFPVSSGPTAGGRYADWPSRMFDRAVAAAGLIGTAHKLRHSYAAHFLAAVPDLTLLAELLGHSDQAVTKLYKHLLPGHLARARNAVQIAAPAEALGLARFRAGHKPSGSTVRTPLSGAGTMPKSAMITVERATGIEPATSSLGSVTPRAKIAKLLK